MARDQFVVPGGSAPGEEAGVLMHSSAGLLLLSMIIFSLSIISMVIFACGDGNSGKHRSRRGGFWDDNARARVRAANTAAAAAAGATAAAAAAAGATSATTAAGGAIGGGGGC